MARKSELKRNVYLDRSIGLLTNVIDEVRRISKVLVVPGMHELGVLENIRNLISDLTDIQPVTFDFHADEHVTRQLDKKIQLTIFRIVQEQINNILKHANATHVLIDLSIYEEELILLISDNGRGHNLELPSTGVGILNIKSRVAVHHGTIHISSEPGNGYTLQVNLPLREPYKD